MLFSITSGLGLVPTQLPIKCVPGVKRQEREIGHCSAEVKNGGAIPPLPNSSSWCGAYIIKPRDNHILPYL
jgi:hypothetical protein